MVEKKGFSELKEKVINTELCSRCGACVLVCPYPGVLDYYHSTPRLIGKCVDCGICLRVCPRYNDMVNELEESVFGRTRRPEEKYGIYKQVIVAKSLDDETLKKCQDGGAVTSLLVSALETGDIDGAIVSGLTPSKPWLPVPMLVTTREDIISSAGTRYAFSPNILALKEAVGMSLKNVAFVGTPCQIQAIRQIQQVPLRKYGDIVKFTIGLFCTESFTYEGLMLKEIQGNLGIDLNEIKSINIKGKLIITTKDGNQYKLSLKEVKKYTEMKCSNCMDFSAELADISVGGVGLDGYTLTVLRTNLGVSILKDAVKRSMIETESTDNFQSAMNLLIKLSETKRKAN